MRPEEPLGGAGAAEKALPCQACRGQSGQDSQGQLERAPQVHLAGGVSQAAPPQRHWPREDSRPLKDPVVHSLGTAGGHLPSTPVTLNHTGWCDPRETGSISDVLDSGSWRDQGGEKGRAGRPGGRTGAEPGGVGRGWRDPSPASCSTSTCLCPPCSLAAAAHRPPSPLSNP